MCLTLQYLLFGIKIGRSFFLIRDQKGWMFFINCSLLENTLQIFFFTQGWYGAKTIIYISKKREIFQQAMAENINTLFLFQFHVSLSYII